MYFPDSLLTCTTPTRLTGSLHPTGLTNTPSSPCPLPSPSPSLGGSAQASPASKNCRQAPCTVPPQRRHRYHRFSAAPPASHKPRQAAHSGGGGGDGSLAAAAAPPSFVPRGFRGFLTRWNSWGPHGREGVAAEEDGAPPPVLGGIKSAGSMAVLTWKMCRGGEQGRTVVVKLPEMVWTSVMIVFFFCSSVYRSVVQRR